MERMDKILSATGKWSRSEIKTLVKAGRITANGAVVRTSDEKFAREGLRITVNGREELAETHYYIMLHKPQGVLSATEDRKQKTVLDLLPQYLQNVGLFPVGRLDKDTEGLLLLTNDGPLGHKLLAPKWHVDKVYFTRVEGTLMGEDVAAFASGMELADGTLCRPAGLELLSDDTALVTLREGKYHQIKRMLAARGKPVTYLKRCSMGPLTLDEALITGAWRFLNQEELEAVFALL